MNNFSIYELTYTLRNNKTLQVEQFTVNICAENADCAKRVIDDAFPNSVLYMSVNRTIRIHGYSPRVLRTIGFQMFETVKKEKESALTLKAEKPEYRPVYTDEPVKEEPQYQLFRKV